MFKSVEGCAPHHVDVRDRRTFMAISLFEQTYSTWRAYDNFLSKITPKNLV